MTERKWWPIELLEEGAPDGLTSPDLFIVGKVGAALRLDYPDDAKGITEGWRRIFRRPLSEGDIVNFFSFDTVGTAQIRFRQDGTWTEIDPAPSDFNCCWVMGDAESSSETLADLARELVEIKALEDEDELWTVEFGTLSDSIPHKFHLTANGPSFSIVSQGEARQ